MIQKARETAKRHLTIGLDALDKIAQSVIDGALAPAVYYAERSISIEFIGDVLSKERPRMTMGGHAYTPKKTADYEKAIRAIAEATMVSRSLAPLRCPVVTHLTVRMAIPNGWNADKVALSHLIRPSVRDLDNQEKAVFDAINGVVYYDDSQIVQHYANKRYVAGNEKEGFSLSVTPCGLIPTDVDTVLKMIAIKRKAMK